MKVTIIYKNSLNLIFISLCMLSFLGFHMAGKFIFEKLL